MQCPSCNASLPSDLRYCLQCGQYLGELSETTWVRPPQVQPTSKIPADKFVPKFESIEPQERHWSFGIGTIVLVGACLLIIGGLITALLLYGAGGTQTDIPGNKGLSTLTPSPTKQRAQSPSPMATPVPRTDALITPTPQPRTTLFPRPPPTPSTEEFLPARTIVSQTFAVPPGQYVSYPILVPGSGC